MIGGQLCVLVDCNACSWAERIANEAQFSCVLSSIIAFCNAYLAQSARNRLVVLASAHAIRHSVIYSNYSESTSTDASVTIRSHLKECLRESAASDNASRECPLAASLATALCHIGRARREGYRSARILIIHLSSSDSSQHHSTLMNILFAAQKESVVVDVCSLSSRSSAVLQQACDITGGIYIEVDQIDALLQYMLTNCLADESVRRQLLVPELNEVDYRPSCRCHNQLVSLGWVCSVCLSVQCQFTPICSICKTVFKISVLPKSKKRKRPAV